MNTLKRYQEVTDSLRTLGFEVCPSTGTVSILDAEIPICDIVELGFTFCLNVAGETYSQLIIEELLS